MKHAAQNDAVLAGSWRRSNVSSIHKELLPMMDDLQQTAIQLHAIAHSRGEEHHQATTRKHPVLPQRVGDECIALVLFLILHPSYEHWDQDGTDDQKGNGRCLVNTVDIGR